ncbi:MAG: sulfatase-like hydrolase/transferase [Limnochordia bacterium]|jgi:choline-sulfatase
MSSKNPDRPNVLFILSDDQGAWAMGCAGNPEIQTPNLDRLAARGMRFENFFCTSPVCSPARASLLTGRMPSQHGIHDWLREGNDNERPVEYLAGQIAYTDILAANGYVCGLSGKWHLGDSFKRQKGFTHWYVHLEGGGPYYNAPMIRDGRLVREPEYLTDLITDDALSFLDASGRDDRPFYLSVHYTAPHSPWLDNHPQEIVDLYRDCPFESCPQEPIHPWAENHPLTDRVNDNVRGNLQGYFAAVTAMDLQIGRLLDRLETLGLTDNTLVFFTSDNGFSCGLHGFWGKGNGTFPLNMYDSSIKVPAIASHPSRIPEGVVSHTLLSGYDFMPTLLDYLGLDSTVQEGLPGRSFFSDLQGKTDPGRDHVVVYDEYGPVRMIRTLEWKYVHRYPYGPHELYNIGDDPLERVNLVDLPEFQDVVIEMRSQLQDWFIRYSDPQKDGRHEAVTGEGQLALAGPAGRGVQAFASSRLQERPKTT